MYADFSGSEPDTALMEEREALNIQRKMAEQLADEDFGLDIFKAGSHRHYLPLNLFEETIFSGIKGNFQEIANQINVGKLSIMYRCFGTLPVVNLLKYGFSMFGCFYLNTVFRTFW